MSDQEIDKENQPQQLRPALRFGTVPVDAGQLLKHPSGALELGPRKRAYEALFFLLQRQEIRVYCQLLRAVPGLEERLMESSNEEVVAIAGMLQKGANSARADDTKSLKGPVIDWIAPQGQPLHPPLVRNLKLDRGFNHPRTGQLLCPAGMDWSNVEVQKQLKNREVVVPGGVWPLFVYRNEVFDEEEPWQGLFRNELLIKAFKHVYTSPSSVDDELKATRSGNARIHGMTRVTRASIAYIATQMRFALSSASIFSCTDRDTDSEAFYNSVLGLLEDPDEQDEVKELLEWWNRRIFPAFADTQRVVPVNSALAKIKQRRQILKQKAQNQQARGADVP